MLYTQYYSGDQIKKNEMGGACSTWGRGEERTGFWWGDLREGGHLEDLDVDGNIILKWIFKKWEGGHGWGWSDIEWGQLVDCCECANEP